MSASEGGWQPQRDIEIVAGTPPGGGLDRAARALAAALEERHLLEVPVRVVNIPGDGAREAWRYMDGHAGDPHVLAISSPNLTTDRLLGMASFDLYDYTPLATLYTEYIAFVARSDGTIADAQALLQCLAVDPRAVTVALSTALGNPNHIAYARLVRHAGRAPGAAAVRVFDSALDAVADVVAGHADVGAITAASAVQELRSGTLRALAVSSPERLPGLYASAPTWSELGVDCVMGAWRGVSGCRGLASGAVAFWAETLEAAAGAAGWQEALVRQHWTAMLLSGAALKAFLTGERREMETALRELGLLDAPG